MNRIQVIHQISLPTIKPTTIPTKNTIDNRNKISQGVENPVEGKCKYFGNQGTYYRYQSNNIYQADESLADNSEDNSQECNRFLIQPQG